MFFGVNVVTTIQLTEATHKRLKRYGSVGQSFSDLIDDFMDFVDENEEEFETFLDEKYGEEEE